LVLLFCGICFGGRYSGDCNTTQRKGEICTTRSADITVLRFCRTDNYEPHGETYKQMSVIDIRRGILSPHEDIPCGKEQIDILSVRLGIGHNRLGGNGLGVDTTVRIHAVATWRVSNHGVVFQSRTVFRLACNGFSCGFGIFDF
jgi:hypothetical protein